MPKKKINGKRFQLVEASLQLFVQMALLYQTVVETTNTIDLIK